MHRLLPRSTALGRGRSDHARAERSTLTSLSNALATLASTTNIRRHAGRAAGHHGGALHLGLV